MSILIIFVIISFKLINNQAIIAQLFTFAGYTYGPLLGLYSFGLLTSYKANGKLIPVIALISPLISYALSRYSEVLLNGYQIGFELLLINGLITFIGLYLTRKQFTN
jgi:hypothetical protein